MEFRDPHNEVPNYGAELPASGPGADLPVEYDITARDLPYDEHEISDDVADDELPDDGVAAEADRPSNEARSTKSTDELAAELAERALKYGVTLPPEAAHRAGEIMNGTRQVDPDNTMRQPATPAAQAATPPTESPTSPTEPDLKAEKLPATDESDTSKATPPQATPEVASSTFASAATPKTPLNSPETPDEPPVSKEIEPTDTPPGQNEPQEPTPEPTESAASEHPQADRPVEAPNEADLDNDKPLLPSTEADVKWEAWHGGEVDIVDNGLHTAELQAAGAERVAKIYRAGGEARHSLTITDVTGLQFTASGRDIVQIHSKNSDGTVSETPTHVFQGNRYVPSRWVTVEEHLTPEEQQQIADIRAAVADLADDPDTPPIAGRPTALSRGLSALHTATNTFSLHPAMAETIPSGNENEVLAHYPTAGIREVAVITPGGFLLKGHRFDVIEVLHHGPDGGYERVDITTLGRLAERARYIRLL